MHWPNYYALVGQKGSVNGTEDCHENHIVEVILVHPVPTNHFFKSAEGPWEMDGTHTHTRHVIHVLESTRP